MDALSDVLISLRLEGAVYINAEFTALWCVQSKFGLASVRARLAGAEHVLFFHFLTEGRCKVRLADSMQALDVAAGDLVVFPNEDKHVMGSDLHLAPVETASLIGPNAAVETDLIQMRHGGGGAATRFVCGYFGCSRSVCRPLLEALFEHGQIKQPLAGIVDDFDLDRGAVDELAAEQALRPIA